jgi:hypothetical protein
MDDKIVAIVRRALIVAAIVLLGSVVWTGSRSREPSPSSADEQVFCASAICFYDSVRGKECLDFQPTVSKLIPVPDVRGDSVRLVIEATGKECKERR